MLTDYFIFDENDVYEQYTVLPRTETIITVTDGHDHQSRSSWTSSANTTVLFLFDISQNNSNTNLVQIHNDVSCYVSVLQGCE